MYICRPPVLVSTYFTVLAARPWGTLGFMFKLASNWATTGVTLAARLELQFVVSKGNFHFWLVTAYESHPLIGPWRWLCPNPNLNLRYQLEPPGGGTPEGRPGRMHFADGLYFIWWQRCEALVLRLGKWGDGRDGMTWKSLTERKILNYNSLFAWILMVWFEDMQSPGKKFVKVEQTLEICTDNILLAS